MRFLTTLNKIESQLEEEAKLSVGDPKRSQRLRDLRDEVKALALSTITPAKETEPEEKKTKEKK